MDKAAIQQITLKELASLNHREGFIKRGIRLHFDASLINFLTTIGFDERYGARPLQRAVEAQVINPMANWLLQHPTIGQTNLNLTYQDGLIVEKR